MLLHPNASNVEISEGFASTSFTIVDAKNSFALLQGRQYEDPINATLRALVENALDAQADTQNTQLIRLDIYGDRMIVKDQGSGISPDDFQQYFIQFFASNRTHSNRFHGFFGVGSKAPLAVASEFHVRTVHQGMEYTWRCQRGQPAPSAMLLGSKVADSLGKGTTIEIQTVHMDDTTERNPWLNRAVALASTMPTLLDLQVHIPQFSTSHPRKRPDLRAPVLSIGGMPYPCPASDILDLPDHYYEPCDLAWEEWDEKPSVPFVASGRFGKDSPKTTKKVMRTASLRESLTIPFAIGDLELHFSKEKVASTPTNIRRIRTAVEQAWLDWQYTIAERLRAQYSPVAWRLPIATAKALQAQGYDAAVLAWASRPLCVSGPPDLLEPNRPLAIVQRDPTQPTRITNKWIAAINNGDALDAVRAWATEWGIPLQWRAIPNKNNTLEVPMRRELDTASWVRRIPYYDARLESITARTSSATSGPLVFIAADSDWGSLNDDSKRAVLDTIKMFHISKPDVFQTTLNMADVKKGHPRAIDIKHYCTQLLNDSLKGIPEDALGIRQVIVNCDHKPAPSWASWSQASCIKTHFPISLETSETVLEGLSLVHAWTGVPSPVYANMAACLTEQTQKIPLLSFLSTYE